MPGGRGAQARIPDAGTETKRPAVKPYGALTPALAFWLCNSFASGYELPSPCAPLACTVTSAFFVGHACFQSRIKTCCGRGCHQLPSMDSAGDDRRMPSLDDLHATVVRTILCVVSHISVVSRLSDESSTFALRRFLDARR